MSYLHAGRDDGLKTRGAIPPCLALQGGCSVGGRLFILWWIHVTNDFGPIYKSISLMFDYIPLGDVRNHVVT